MRAGDPMPVVDVSANGEVQVTFEGKSYSFCPDALDSEQFSR
jgi:hypothetical protein